MGNGLVDRGLLSRRPSLGDGRRADLTLTKKGQHLLERADTRCEGALASLAADAAGNDALDLVGSLHRWLSALDKPAERLPPTADDAASG
jgi:DNA-binding MarR family transcriptional regulator